MIGKFSHPIAAIISAAIAIVQPQIGIPQELNAQPIDTIPRRIIFKAHLSAINYLAFTPNGQTLVSSAWDDRVNGRARSTIKLWNPISGELKSSLIAQATSAFAISPNSETIATAQVDIGIKLYELNTGKEISAIENSYVTIYNLAFSPNGEFLAASTPFGSKIWNVRTGELSLNLKQSEIVRCVAFSPDGQIVASGGHDNNIKLWDVRTGEVKKTLSGHSKYVGHLAFSRDGATLASSSEDDTIKLWNVRTGQLLKTLSSGGSSIAFSPDGTSLVSAGSPIEVWNLRTGETITSFTGGTSTIALSPDGKILASEGKDGTINIWQLNP